MDGQLFYGLVALVCGAFMLTYGASLFRLVLAFAGFYVGFVAGMMIPAPSDFFQIMIAVVAGAAVAALLYFLTKITMYAAGALFGLVLGLLLASLFGQQGGTIAYIIGAAGAVVGGIFGKRMGSWAMILASAGAGAYATVVGVNLLLTDQATVMETGLMPTSLPAYLIFIVFAAVSILAQLQIVDLRRRIRNR